MNFSARSSVLLLAMCLRYLKPPIKLLYFMLLAISVKL